jgi:hypothetical protein
LRHDSKGRFAVRAVGWLALLMSLPAQAQGTSVLTGTVSDSSSGKAVEDVVVTATSPALQGEQIVVTDSSGLYRLPNLPPGTYELRLEKEGFKPFTRGGIDLGLNQTLRVNVDLLPEALEAPEVTIIGRPPVVDVGSSATGTAVDPDIVARIAMVRPGGKNSAMRSFESIAEMAPGAFADEYGVSLSGTTSPENAYRIDGLSVNDPALGVLGTSMPIEFIQEMNIINGGYMPEYGRSSGGILDVVTKSGSNELRGSVWMNVAPGALSGSVAAVSGSAGTISTRTRLWNEGDFGVDLGGAIVKDRLWFYAGFAPSMSRTALDRSLNRLVLDSTTLSPVADANGNPLVEPIPNTQRRFFADQRTYSYLGKLTYLVSPNHQATLSVYGAPQSSGGRGRLGVIPLGGKIEGSDGLNGTLGSIAHLQNNFARDVSLRWSSAFADKRLLLDITGGWHHQTVQALPSDGARMGSDDGLAGLARVVWRRQPERSITEFESLPDPSVCTPPPGATVDTLCPALDYSTGGAGFLTNASEDSFQGRVMGTALWQALGHHVLKAGFDANVSTYRNLLAYSGGVIYNEDPSGDVWYDAREYSYATGPDELAIHRTSEAFSRGTLVGGFIQDSWSILDVITLNAGIRYDHQTFVGEDGQIGMVLANQWSPRVGLVYDFTQEGRSKIFANYARYYANTPMDVVDRLLPGHPSAFVARVADPTGQAGCNPSDPVSQRESCFGSTNAIPINSPNDPNQTLFTFSNEKAPVDPNLQAESLDEIVVGAEYEIFTNARLGLTYTRRRQNAIIEDLSVNEGASYFIGNPGYGVGKVFPKATRNYDAGTLSLSKRFSALWLLEASYTLSRLYGNYSGLYRPETAQLNPNNSSDFDLVSLLANRTGALPQDRTHNIKLFGARDIPLGGRSALSVGLSYRGASGGPLNYLAAHPSYGTDEAFLLPRGSAGRLQWVHSIDTHVGYAFRFTQNQALSIGVDIFNLFNFQAVTRREETYTFASPQPIEGGTKNDLGSLQNADGSPFDPQNVNPGFLTPLAYQSPRVFRFSAKFTF